MKSSISSLARFFSSGRRSTTRAVLEHRPRSIVSRSSAPLLVPQRRIACATLVLQPHLLVEPGHARHAAAAAAPLAVEPRRDARRRRAWRGCARARGRRPTRSRRRRRRRASRSTTASRSSPSGCSDVRSVESFSGSIGKTLRRRVDRRRVACARARRSACPSAPARRRRRPRRARVTRRRRSGSATVSWSRSRESSLSIEHHESCRRSAVPSLGAGACNRSAWARAAGGKSGALQPCGRAWPGVPARSSPSIACPHLFTAI